MLSMVYQKLISTLYDLICSTGSLYNLIRNCTDSANFKTIIPIHVSAIISDVLIR